MWYDTLKWGLLVAGVAGMLYGMSCVNADAHKKKPNRVPNCIEKRIPTGPKCFLLCYFETPPRGDATCEQICEALV